jgi:tRNA(adenine34) deaminase
MSSYVLGLHPDLACLPRLCLDARFCMQASGEDRLDGCTLYTTLEPCLMCFGACILHRLDRVVFAASSPKFGVCGSVLNIPSTHTSRSVDHKLTFNHMPAVHGGLFAEQSASLLRAFFLKKRAA